MSIAALFPGQGSQSRGMGAALFERYPDWTQTADEILGYSIRELCVDDPREQLVVTTFTQPALFVVNALTWRAREDDGAERPAFVAGHSLGEFNALLAAGVFDFATGLRLVRRRGEIMGQVQGGGMAAVVGLAPAQIEEILGRTEAGQRLDIANFNSFDQTVIAGPREDIAAVEADFDAAGVRAFVTLNVSAPFHSRYMHEPMAAFARELDGVQFASPQIPVVANVTGVAYSGDIRATLARQIGHSVRWLDSMLFMFDNGVSDVVEVGPGKVLAKLAQQIKKKRPAGA